MLRAERGDGYEEGWAERRLAGGCVAEGYGLPLQQSWRRARTAITTGPNDAIQRGRRSGFPQHHLKPHAIPAVGRRPKHPPINNLQLLGYYVLIGYAGAISFLAPQLAAD